MPVGPCPKPKTLSELKEAQNPSTETSELKLYMVLSNLHEHWEVYEGMVVCAESEEQARNIHPKTSREGFVMEWQDTKEAHTVYGVSTRGFFYQEREYWEDGAPFTERKVVEDWNVNPADLDVIMIGTPSSEYKAGDVIMAQYHHG